MTQQPTQTANDVSDSKFLMFRCLISLAHADGLFTDTEKDFIINIMDSNRLDDSRRQVLEREMASPSPIEELFPQITDPLYRGQVVHFARVMAYKDGRLDHAEQDILDKLHANAMKNIDMDALREQVRKTVDQKMVQFDIELYEKKHPLFQKFERLLEKIGLKW